MNAEPVEQSDSSHPSTNTTNRHAVAMSATKRSRQRQSGAVSTPASKRIKTTNSTHVPANSGLAFLINEKARAGKELDAKLTNGVSRSKTSRIDESRAQVAADDADEDGVNVRAEDVMGEDEDSDSEADEDEQEAGAADGAQGLSTNGHVSDSGGENEAHLGAKDDRMEDVDGKDGDEEAGEPSFGDMLQARHPEIIDVHADNAKEEATVVPASKTAAPLSGTSLATVVKQALRTNDKDQLEACFAITDLPSIRTSIQRLESQYAAQLLQRLAERMYKKPGRAGTLMIWVQWTLVTHGGYLSTQPDMVRGLRSLSQVVRARAGGLQPLLHLKGKLDLLNSQLELRRNLQAASRAAQISDDNEDAVLYVDGQDDDWSDDEDVDMDGAMRRKSIQMPKLKAHETINVDDSEEEDHSGDDMPNGVAPEAEESEEEDEERQAMFDDEAGDTSNDEGEDESDDDGDTAPETDEDEEPSNDDESEPEIKAPQPKTLSRKR